MRRGERGVDGEDRGVGAPGQAARGRKGGGSEVHTRMVGIPTAGLERQAGAWRGALSSSTSSAGSRRTRATVPGSRLRSSISPASLQAAQAALGDEALVDGAHAALEGRPHRRAERDGLAVHRAAGADDDVGVGDERLGVDRALGDDEAVQLGALLGDARQDDGLRAAQAVEDVGEDVVLEAVVERHHRRRAHDGHRLRGVEAQLVEHRRVGLEVGEVVLLLQARVALQLAPRAVARPAARAGSPRARRPPGRGGS